MRMSLPDTPRFNLELQGMRAIGIRSLIAVFCTLLFVRCAKAQQGTTQLWLDGTVGQAFAAYYKGELEVGYRSVISKDDPWETFRLVPRVSVAPTAHWTFMMRGYFISAVGEGKEKTLEMRIQPGVKYNFTPFERVQSRLMLRYEFRSITSGDDVQHSQRLRIRAEMAMPLDTRNYHSDTMWYALGDAEAFYGPGQEVDERFANRIRLRAGLGRKFSYNMALEALYNWQGSRTDIGDDDLLTDQIIRISFKYFFSPRVRKLPADPTSP